MKISVITVNYNNASGLERTLKSVISQKHADFEYVVIDGGSTDGSKYILEKCTSQIVYWVSEKDTGIYEAMNKGIKAAKGEYLLFLNSGDCLFEESTLSKAETHLDGRTEIVYGDLKITEKDKISEGYSPDTITLDHMMRDTLWHPVSFIRADLFKRYGLYSTEYRICGDYDFFFKTLIIKKVSSLHIKQFIAVFELNGLSSDLNNHPRINEEKKKIQRSYLSEAEIQAYFEQQKKSSKKSFFGKWFR